MGSAVEDIAKRLEKHVNREFFDLGGSRNGSRQPNPPGATPSVGGGQEAQPEKTWSDYVSPRRVDEIQRLVQRVNEMHEAHLSHIANKVSNTHISHTTDREKRTDDLEKELEDTRKAMESTRDELQGELDTIHRAHDEEMSMLREGYEHKMKRLKSELVALRKKYEGELQVLREKYQKLLESTSSEVDRQLEIQQRKLAARALMDIKGRQKNYESEMEIMQERQKATEAQNKELKDSMSRLRIEGDMKQREMHMQLQQMHERFEYLRQRYVALQHEMKSYGIDVADYDVGSLRQVDGEGGWKGEGDEQRRGSAATAPAGISQSYAGSPSFSEGSFSRPPSRGTASFVGGGRVLPKRGSGQSKVKQSPSFHNEQKIALLEKKLAEGEQEQQKMRETIVFLVRQLKEKGRMTHSFATSDIMRFASSVKLQKLQNHNRFHPSRAAAKGVNEQRALQTASDVVNEANRHARDEQLGYDHSGSDSDGIRYDAERERTRPSSGSGSSLGGRGGPWHYDEGEQGFPRAGPSPTPSSTVEEKEKYATYSRANPSIGVSGSPKRMGDREKEREREREHLRERGVERLERGREKVREVDRKREQMYGYGAPPPRERPSTAEVQAANRGGLPDVAMAVRPQTSSGSRGWEVSE